MSFKIRLALIITMLIVWGVPVHAQMLEINPETKTKGQISKGDLTALINVQKTEDWKPTVTVLLKGKAVGKLEGSESPFPAALVQITELDPSNPYPEVLLSSFTGGAHCCNEVSILTSDKSGKRWQKVSLA